MTDIRRKVRTAQRRLWLNRWFTLAGWSLAAAGAAWCLLVAVARICALEWPLAMIGGAFAAVALIASLISLLTKHESVTEAAAAIDASAGLKERVSTSFFCTSQDDPFAAAVVEDARRVLTGMAIGRLVPVRGSRSMGYALGAFLAGAMLFWLLPTYDLLGRAAARADALKRGEQKQIVRESLAKPIEAMKAVAEAHPELDAARDASDLMEMLKGEKAEVPADKMRIEAIKKLDRLSEELRDKLDSDKYDMLDAMKQMMSQLGQNAAKQSLTSPLLDAMKQQDFKAARETLSEMKEQLARRDHSAADAAKAQEIKKQLEELANQLDQLQSNAPSAEKLKEMGMSEKDIRRVLDSLSKKDSKQLEQLAKELGEKLQKNGMSPSQAKQLAEKANKLMQQMKNDQQAMQQCKDLAKKLSGAAKAMQNGKQEDAQGEMGDVGEQLSEMEMMAEEMNQLESQAAEMEQMKEDLSNSCDKCGGKGCKECKGGGEGEGNGEGDGRGSGKGDHAKGRGRGYGLRDRAPEGPVAFARKKAKTPIGKGSLIGTQYIKGEMLRGEAKAEYSEAAEAAEREATDALDNDRVPRSYHRAVKSYFDRFGNIGKETPETPPPGNAAGTAPKAGK